MHVYNNDDHESSGKNISEFLTLKSFQQKRQTRLEYKQNSKRKSDK